MSTGRGSEFAALAYSVIVTEKRFSAKKVAMEMGLGYDALHARLVNRTPFSAEEIRRLIRAAPDSRLVGWLLRGTSFVGADRCSAPAATDAADSSDAEAIHRSATRIVLEAADVLESVERALADSRIDHRDALEIRQEIEIAERALASLGQHLRTVVPLLAHDGV